MKQLVDEPILVESQEDIENLRKTYKYENNVGVERTKIKRMEMKALVDQIISNQENQLLSVKYEDSSF